MKKSITTSMMLLFMAANVFSQNNIQLFPASGNVCNPMELSLNINGNSFTPISYQWSTGETSPTIEIVASGMYTLTVTGYHGSSKNLVTITKSENYTVLPAPVITELTDLWVCKGDTVRLAAVTGYDYVNWSNGTSGILFEKEMNKMGIPGTPELDTLTISYSAGINGVCSTNSQTRLLRSIRKPHGVGVHYQNKMNISINDSIPAGLVLEYIYPVTYEMEITDLNNPMNFFKYVTAPGSRKMAANLLTPGGTYSVVTTPVINDKRFCSGTASTIGMALPSSHRMTAGFIEEEGMKTYRIYNVQGQMLLEKQAEDFNMEWVKEIAPQMLIIHKSGLTNEVTRLQLVK